MQRQRYIRVLGHGKLEPAAAWNSPHQLRQRNSSSGGEHQNSDTSKGSSKIWLKRSFCLSQMECEITCPPQLGRPRNFQDPSRQKCPSPPGDANPIKSSADIMLTVEQWKIDSNYFYSILFLATHGCTQKPVKQSRGIKSTTAPATKAQRP